MQKYPQGKAADYFAMALHVEPHFCDFLYLLVIYIMSHLLLT